MAVTSLKNLNLDTITIGDSSDKCLYTMQYCYGKSYTKVFNPLNKTLGQFSIEQKYNNTRSGMVQSLGLMKQGKHERIFGM